jgi:acyl-CoA thioesterase I
MHRYLLRRRVTLLFAAAAIPLTITAAWAAEAPGSAALSTAPRSAVPASRPPICVVDTGKAHFAMPLVRVSQRLAAGKPVKIVALGSSSTYGAGASSRAASYPSRLAEELAVRLPGHKITIVNRGVGGDEAADMLARLDRDVVAEKPDLVLWQVGTNSVLRDKAVLPHATLLHEGLQRLKAIGADVVLIDPQYAPKVIAKPDHEGMVSLIATAAKAEHVCLFNRFALMRQWRESEHLPFESFVSSDGLHMNDWSYACLAKWLGAAIAEAATRPTVTVATPLSRH